MKRILSFLIPAIILVVIAAIIAFKLKNNKKIAQERVYHYDKPVEAQAKNDSAQFAIPSKMPDGKLLYTGTFEPYKDTKVSAEIQGKINKVLVDAGSLVSKEQTLIQLDNALLKLQVQSVEVQIEGLEADVKRFRILAKADAVQGVQLEKAELGLQSAYVQKAIFMEQINKSSIKAPFSGVVAAKLSEEGSFAAPGVPLLQIIDIAQLRFTINVPENDLPYFQLNQTYRIIADAYPETVLTGKVTMIGSKANAGNSFQVQFLVKNIKNNGIKAGMFGQLHIKN